MDMKKKQVVRTEYVVRTTVKDGRDTATSEKVISEEGMVEVLRALGYEVSDLPKRVREIEDRLDKIDRDLDLVPTWGSWSLK